MIQLPPDVVGTSADIEKIVDIFNTSVLETYLEEHGAACAPALVAIKNQEGGTPRVSLVILNDLFNAKGEDELADPRELQKIHDIAAEIDGELILIAICGESVIGKKNGQLLKGVFTAAQSIDGDLSAHIYIQNNPDDTSGHFSEPKDIAPVAKKAAKRVVGALWRQYLVTKAVNS